VEEDAPDAGSAEASSSTVAAFLLLAKGAESVLPMFTKNDDLKQLLNSTKVEQKGSQAVLTATLPDGLLKELAAAPDKLSGTSAGK
jgi:hypothetical protein